MAGSIPQVFIDDLLIRTDIIDLIDKYVPLKKSGSNYVALCPFHTEKTPSFSVNSNKQFYHCFGCGASGNAINFLMAYSHLDFPEAIEDLAASAGVEVLRENELKGSAKKDKQELKSVYALLQEVALEYANQLRHSENQKAVAYFKSRSVTGKLAKQFLLGYAPEGWGFLADRFDRRILLQAGLVVEKEAGKIYDRFRGRVMFPIRDRRGRVVGFGGRVLDDVLPKYLNSPESAVFHKGHEVYGLFELLEVDSKPRHILVTEGYMDVIALAQTGITNSVACLGTATSKEHIHLLFRFTRDLVFCFDGDKAGRKAAWRAVAAALPALKEGRQVRIMLLPDGTDPDSLLADEGKLAFEHRISAAGSLSSYFFEHLSQDLSLTTIEGRAALVEVAMPYLDRLPNGTYREMMMARLKELAKTNTLDVFHNPTTINPIRRMSASTFKAKSSPIRISIALLLQNPRLIKVVEAKNIDWSALNMPGLALLKKIVQRIIENPEINMAALMSGFHDLPEEKQVLQLAQWQVLIPESGLEAEFEGALERLLEQSREQQLANLIAKEQKQGLNDGERKLLLNMVKKQ